MSLQASRISVVVRREKEGRDREGERRKERREG